MKVTYYISENTFRDVMLIITKKVKYFGYVTAQLICIIYVISSFLKQVNHYPDTGLLIREKLFVEIIAALGAHFLFWYGYQMAYLRKAVNENRNTLGHISIELNDEFIYIISEHYQVKYKRDNVFRIKEFDTAYCILLSKWHKYIVIPKHSGLPDAVDEQEYVKSLDTIITELEKTSKFKKT
ncbi:hypothetical protein ACFDTO_21500 [Microbacteriaceae bacterium 4G12]